MPMNDAMVEAAAHRFALLGDPTRLRILQAIMARGELSVGAVAEAVSTSRFNASAHLARLADGGLLARRRKGTSVYYRTNDANLPRICDWMCESLRSQARDLTAPERSTSADPAPVPV
ncbi:MAG TPA: metalloregulator ArsR/SmtB family transcription factor [Candidatus Polarisedimenticolia bacterium]|nr:metalloregulator ArsR/SmtB family transcription factor [Candidatus Polarisedimenticolia bacterium]